MPDRGSSEDSFTLPAPSPLVLEERRERLADLAREAASHAALSHSFVAELELGHPTPPAAAFRAFATGYRSYSAWFPRFLEAVIAKLPSPEQRELLGRNLSEERGQLSPADRTALELRNVPLELVEGIPHPQLFERFYQAVVRGASRADGAHLPTSDEPAVEAGRAWRAAFLQLLLDASPMQALGALGLGTESIVAPLYTRLLRGLERLDGLERADRVFFELHCTVDDGHADDLAELAVAGLTDERQLRELRKGMLAALDLRCAFWERLAVHCHSLTAEVRHA